MILGLPPSVRIYFATALVDMRNGIDGLRAVVEHTRYLTLGLVLCSGGCGQAAKLVA